MGPIADDVSSARPGYLASVSAPGGLYFWYVKTGAHAPTALFQSNSDATFRPVTVPVELSGTLQGMGAIPLRGHRASGKELAFLFSAGSQASTGKSQISFQEVYTDNSVGQVQTKQFDSTGVVGSPTLAFYKDTFWAFYSDPTKSGYLQCTAFRLASSSLTELYTGRVTTGPLSADLRAKTPVATAVFADTLYIAYTSQEQESLNHLHVVTKRIHGSAMPIDSQEAFAFSEPSAAYVPSVNQAFGDDRFIILDCNPAMCIYNGLLRLVYPDILGDKKLYELTYDGRNNFGIEKTFQGNNWTSDAIQVVAHNGSMYTFYYGAP